MKVSFRVSTQYASNAKEVTCILYWHVYLLTGPGLVFVVYPEAISQMPVATLWAILFFVMLIFLGFSSEVNQNGI